MAGYRLSLRVGGGTLSNRAEWEGLEMPRYLVHGIVKIDVQSEIEADSEAEAMLIASQMSGSDFDEEGLTDGEEIFISTAQLIEEDTNEI
jgi:hypothetical protein